MSLRICEAACLVKHYTCRTELIHHQPVDFRATAPTQVTGDDNIA